MLLHPDVSDCFRKRPGAGAGFLDTGTGLCSWQYRGRIKQS